jgi:CRP/FNR family transcriptional regulator, dissimilatory nitrate respiration regulator
VNDLTLKDASTRLASWLVQHCPDPHSAEPQRIELRMTKHLLAQELGLVSETLSRTLHTFRDQRFIDVEGRSITLLCPARLAEFLREKTESPLGDSWNVSREHCAVSC